MKLGLIAVCTLSLVAALGCSSSSDSDDSGGPVAASPLTGQVNGASFAAKSAIARKSGSGGEKKSIDIYDSDVTCEAFAPKADRSILISVPWAAATSRDFKFSLSGGESQTATFVVQKDGQTSNIISTQGRVEVIEAPAEKGALGKIRLRATAQGNSVEGEIAVKVCD
jgi:hypothetical protein